MPETIRAAELQMVEVFDDKYQFKIPDYQRPYSWTSEQTGELLDDLLYAVRQSKNLEDASPYFLGSVVIVKNDISPKAEIVDGQQRITTLTILLCGLRELAGENGSQIDIYIRAPDMPFAGIKGHFRLTVRDRDKRFFQDNIQKMGMLEQFISQPSADLPESQQRMHENAKHLWREISKLNQAQRDELTGFIIQHCYLVVVSTTDQDSAYRIFSVLNDRGLDLSPTDILKAQIIGGFEDDGRSDYTEIWESIEENLGREEFRSLFAHIRMIYMKDKARGELNKEFQENVLKDLYGREFIDGILRPYADAYEKVALPSLDGSDEANLLSHLGRLDNSDWIPPAMEFFRHNPGNSPSALRFIRDLERLAYGLFIRRSDINQRIRRYADLLRAIQDRAELFEEGPLQLSSDEKSEILEKLDGSIYLQLRVRRQLMLRLDSLLADKGVTFQHRVVSIEHVLPQRPRQDSEWLEWFPDEEIRDLWTHRLANLVLLSRRKNAQANNRDFNCKKRTYFMSGGVAHFALTTQVVNEDKWTPEVLERRQKYLIDKLKQEWRLG